MRDNKNINENYPNTISSYKCDQSKQETTKSLKRGGCKMSTLFRSIQGTSNCICSTCSPFFETTKIRRSNETETHL